MGFKNKIMIYVLISFLLFGLVTYLVSQGTFSIMDLQMTLWLQSHLSDFFALPFSVLSVLGSFEITSLLWLLIFLYVLSNRLYLTGFTLPLFFIGLFTEILSKLSIYHQHPPIQLYKGVINLPLPSSLVTEAVTDNSYPSGHILRTAFLVTVLFLVVLPFDFKYKKWVALGLGVFLILMIISRIYLGEHWMSDVIGGLFLGFSLGLVPSLFLPSRSKS